jgi:hypothetical protein
MNIINRDLRRTRVLAALSLLFWLLGSAGMLLLVLGLDRLVIFLRIADGLPWSLNGSSTSTVSRDEEQLFWGTNLIHHSMPFVEGSIIALALAALFTVLLVFSSYQATLTRINLSLAQIAEQLKQSPALSAPALPSGPFTYQNTPRTGLWLVLGAVALLAVISGTIFSTGRFSPFDTAWQGYPRLAPFEAVRWQRQTPQVQVNGTWYELMAIDDVSVDSIVSFSKFRGPTSWQKHFEEDLVELMVRMGHDPGSSVNLKVKDLSSGGVQILKNVPMTSANRDALWNAGLKSPNRT